ncbi:hypothetical protein [Pontibacter populi]|uniref:Uncharacterized protein n=1 Tax=Pontibacter populi TaxID=890055 RepID=A0ABV1RSL9_9BACT
MQEGAGTIIKLKYKKMSKDRISTLDLLMQAQAIIEDVEHQLKRLLVKSESKSQFKLDITVSLDEDLIQLSRKFSSDSSTDTEL